MHRSGFIILAALAAGTASHAGAKVFDPREQKSAIAGAPTQLLVLGTPHLSGMPSGVRAEQLEPLLDRLAAFGPQVITIEALSGHDCELLLHYQAIYGGAYDNFCRGTAEARLATGLTVAAALAEIQKTMADWPEVPSPGDRRRLAALFLAANDRASAQVQWLRLEPAERRAGDGLDSRLVEILDRRGAKLNENYDIAARLAARLGLERVYPTDDHSADAIVADAGEAFAGALGEVRRSKMAQDNRTNNERRTGALADGQDVLDFYRYLNAPATQKALIAVDFGAAAQQQSPELYGRQYLAWWETRNLRMVANVRAAFGDRPGARVLAIVGASHKPYFEAYLDMMQDVVLVDADQLLK